MIEGPRQIEVFLIFLGFTRHREVILPIRNATAKPPGSSASDARLWACKLGREPSRVAGVGLANWASEGACQSKNMVGKGGQLKSVVASERPGLGGLKAWKRIPD